MMFENLEEARQWVLENRPLGVICPCCDLFVKEYQKRTITSMMARVLIAMYLHDEDVEGGWVDMPALTVVGRSRSTGGDEAKSRYWGLIEPMPNVIRDDGSSRVGWWRLTNLGQRFVLGRETVPKYARVFQGECLELVGPPIDIEDALGTRFNYRELMGDAA